MDSLVLVSMAMVTVLIAILIRDFIKMLKIRKMLEETIENCLNILKEREEIKDEERI